MLWKNVDKNTSKVRHISNSKLQSIYTVVKIKNKKSAALFYSTVCALTHESTG